MIEGSFSLPVVVSDEHGIVRAVSIRNWGLGAGLIGAILLGGCSAGSSAAARPSQTSLGDRADVERFFDSMAFTQWSSTLGIGSSDYRMSGADRDGCSIALVGPASSTLVTSIGLTCPDSGGVEIGIPADQVQILKKTVERFAPVDYDRVNQIHTIAASSELSTVNVCRAAKGCPDSPTIYLAVRSSQPPGSSLPALDFKITSAPQA